MMVIRELWNSVLFPFSLAWHQKLAGLAEVGLAAAAAAVMNKNSCHRSRIISVCRSWLCVSEITKTHLRKKSLFYFAEWMSQKASWKDQKNTQTLFISAFKHLERKHKMNKSLMVKREKKSRKSTENIALLSNHYWFYWWILCHYPPQDDIRMCARAPLIKSNCNIFHCWCIHLQLTAAAVDCSSK